MTFTNMLELFASICHVITYIFLVFEKASSNRPICCTKSTFLSVRPSLWWTLATKCDRLRQSLCRWKPQYSDFKKVSLIHIGHP